MRTLFNAKFEVIATKVAAIRLVSKPKPNSLNRMSAQGGAPPRQVSYKGKDHELGGHDVTENFVDKEFQELEHDPCVHLAGAQGSGAEPIWKLYDTERPGSGEKDIE